MRSIVYDTNDIIKILKYTNAEIAMRQHEKQMLLSLCDEQYCIKTSTGIIAGDKICINDGPLKGRESIVKKVNRHKRKAWIEIEFIGNVRLVSVALDIIKKVE